MMRRSLFAVVAFLLLAAALTPPSQVSATPTHDCRPQVLLLGSYPSEVQANLAVEKQDPRQPQVIDGHAFYSGSLAGRRVVIAIAGPSPKLTYSITALALRRFACVSAVVFSGTAGGNGRSGLGDVTVASRWTSNRGRTFHAIGPKLLAVARQIKGKATKQLSAMAPVDDGPCACSGKIDELKTVPILRKPGVVIGGIGTTYGGKDDTCFAQGGELEGCNPCPTGTQPPLVPSHAADGARTSTAAARMAARSARDGSLVRHSRRLLEGFRPEPPAPRASTAGGHQTKDHAYIADDQQTTASFAAARAAGVPFIAFRGISDTSAVGNLWPFEYLVYQQLAADNSAVAARLWIHAWDNDRAARPDDAGVGGSR